MSTDGNQARGNGIEAANTGETQTQELVFNGARKQAGRHYGGLQDMSERLSRAWRQSAVGLQVHRRLDLDAGESRRVGALINLCQIFLEESPKTLRNLRQALAEGDAGAVMRAAHSLKGEVGYLGAGVASQAARKLEDMARENKLTGAPETMTVLEREISALYFAMKDPAGALQ